MRYFLTYKYGILFLLFLGISLQGYSYSFRSYDVNTGLSENTVQVIIQDHKGFMWFGTKDGLNRFDGNDYKVFKKEFDNANSIGNNYIREIYQASDHNIWIGTDKGIYIYKYEENIFVPFIKDNLSADVTISAICGEDDSLIWIGTFGRGLFCYNKSTDILTQYHPKDFSVLDNSIQRVFKDHSGEIWIGSKKGLCKYNRELNNFFTYPAIDPAGKTFSYEVLSIHEDLNGNIWAGTWDNGLMKLNHSTNQFKVFCQEINHIRSIRKFEKSTLLIGSDDGLYLFNTKTEKYFRIDNPIDPISLSDHNIYAIYTDREGGFWIGTYFGGVNYLLSNTIKHYYPTSTPGSLSGKVITQFYEDDKRNVWVATADRGLNYFDKKNNRFVTYLPSNERNSLSYDNIQSLVMDNSTLWCGTFSAGVDVFNLETNSFKNYRFESNNEFSINDDCVFSLYKTSKNEIYAGTRAGLNLYNREKDNFTRIQEVRTFVYDIKEDHLGYLWVATYTRGAFRYDPVKKEWKNYRHDPKSSNSICFDKLTSIYLDEKQRLWFSSEGGGISKYNYDTDDFYTINYKQGLKSNVVYGILDDAMGNMWISSNSGITKINPNNMEIIAYTKEDGLQSNQFNFKSSFKSTDGLFFFGGINGFNMFDPNELVEVKNKYKPPVVITKFELLSENNPQQINFSKKIVLKHNQSSFNIHFSSLSYKAPRKNGYSYILKGLDSKWTNIGNQRSVSFINLPPGKYIFQVKGSNNDGLWNDEGTSIEIIIEPPIYKSTIAYIIYFIALVICGFFFLNYIYKRNKQRQELRMTKFSQQKEAEVYNAKIEFFTNVAHEIRTPVSLIKAPLECIKNTYQGTEADKENLFIIEKNTDRLLELINQLLDFRKVEQDAYRLSFSAISINDLLQDVCFRFKSFAELKNIKIIQHIPDYQIFLFADKEAITKVISNLLNNALKYADQQIDVFLQDSDVSSNLFEIKVQDDGIGIDKNLRTKVFEPFFQIETVSNKQNTKGGAGIGLALCKKLLQSHDGDIFVDESEKGTSIVVRLHKYLSSDLIIEDKGKDIIEMESEIILPKENNLTDDEQMVVMTVEDSEDLQSFLVNNLSSDYRIFAASNGNEALDILDKQVVDLIVSDIIMPDMDGLELTRLVKQDEQYCHIPVIILSSKTNIQDKITGLELGADSYIEKPFSIAYLKAQINSLIENRKKILDKFSKSPVIPYGSIAKNRKDEEFLEKLNKEIEENLLNPDFSVEKLSSSMLMSQSNLQKKIKGISGMVPNDYIRIIKLKKAAQLLLSTNYRINEICYMTGFSSPSYFSKCFQKQFGMLPNEFVKKSKGEM